MGCRLLLIVLDRCCFNVLVFNVGLPVRAVVLLRIIAIGCCRSVQWLTVISFVAWCCVVFGFG